MLLQLQFCGHPENVSGEESITFSLLHCPEYFTINLRFLMLMVMLSIWMMEASDLPKGTKESLCLSHRSKVPCATFSFPVSKFPSNSQIRDSRLLIFLLVLSLLTHFSVPLLQLLSLFHCPLSLFPQLPFGRLHRLLGQVSGSVICFSTSVEMNK